MQFGCPAQATRTTEGPSPDLTTGLPVAAASGLGGVGFHPALNGGMEARELGSRAACRPVPHVAAKRVGFILFDQRGLLSSAMAASGPKLTVAKSLR